MITHDQVVVTLEVAMGMVLSAQLAVMQSYEARLLVLPLPVSLQARMAAAQEHNVRQSHLQAVLDALAFEADYLRKEMDREPIS